MKFPFGNFNISKVPLNFHDASEVSSNYARIIIANVGVSIVSFAHKPSLQRTDFVPTPNAFTTVQAFPRVTWKCTYDCPGDSYSL